MSEPIWLVDPYGDWASREGVPIVRGLYADLTDLETHIWPRFDAAGAIVQLDARGDFLDVHVVDVAPGGTTAPVRHIYEEVVYVVAGRGSTAVTTDVGTTHTFEWGKGSFFALPLNTTYRHFNGSGSETARLASVTNLPLVMNLFRNDSFIFENDVDFPERWGPDDQYRGEGVFTPNREHRHMWETNFVPNLVGFERLQPAPSRGLDSSSIMFVLADSTMHAHLSEMAVGTYKKGHRHPIDFHIIQLNGSGYSLYWYEGDEDYTRIDWSHGLLHAPPDQMFHQHFNTSREPARYLAVAFGGLRYPFTEAKRSMWLRDSRDRKAKFQIDYRDQDPRIHEIYVEELAKNGVELRMDEAFR